MRAPRVARRPVLPTKAEIAEHFPLHLNFRSWCEHCMAGKSRIAQHVVQPSDRERLGITVHMDYAFMVPEEAEVDMQPTLVIYDDDKKAMWALAVEQKGVTEGIVRYLVGVLDQSGYQGQKVTIKTDQEPSILALKRAVSAERVGETVPIESPARASKSNGMMENSVKLWQEQLRTIKHDVESRFGRKIEVDSVLFSWLVPYVADTLNKYKVGVDGVTAYERITGHKCRHFVLGFGETVGFICETDKGNQHKADSRVGVGVFLGYVWRTTEYLIGTKDGIVRCRTIKRRAEEVSYDGECFEYLKINYDEYILKGARTKQHVSTPAGLGQLPIPTRGRDFVPRRLYVRPSDYTRHGYTQGCRGCTWQQNKLGPRAGHSEACRARLEEEISKIEGDDRLQKVQDRQDHFVASKVAEGDKARVDDPRQNENNEPSAQGDAAPTSTAANIPEQYDIGQDDDMISIGDGDMQDVEIAWEDGPSGSTERRLASPSRKKPAIDTETALEDGPGGGNERRLKTPTRRPPSKRRAATGGMFTHDDEPATKKNIVDEPDDEDIDISALAKTHPGVGVLLPGKDGGQTEDRVLAAPEVGVLLAGVRGGSGSNDTMNDEATKAMKTEDELILSKAILGKSLSEVYSNGRIQLAVNRCSMERLNTQLSSTDVSEIFSPERVAAVCGRFGLTPGESMDIKSGFDFDTAADRKRCWDSVIRDEPTLVIGSPPCTMFSRLQELNKHMYRDSKVWMEKFQLGMEQAKRYVRFCTQIYEHQRKHGRYFLHEHPWLATSWAMPEINKLLNYDDVQRVQTHMCQFGMLSRVGGIGSELGPVLKPTGFLTNCPGIARELARTCPRDHVHVPLVGGRAAGAAIYPEKLCMAICRGLAAQKRDNKTRTITTLPMDKNRLSSLSLLCCEASGGHSTEDVTMGGFCLDNIQVEVDGEGKHTGKFRMSRPAGTTKPAGNWPSHWSDMIHEFDGHDMNAAGEDRTGESILLEQLSALYVQNGIDAASDDVTGAWLDPSLVREGRAVEMKFFSDMGVYEIVPRSEQAETGGKIIGTKWIDVNKGDHDNPRIRCRLVGKEFRTGPDDALYASTPPLEALRVVLSRAATSDDGTTRREIMVNDVSRAYFYAKMTRPLYIEVPAEDPNASRDKLGRLRLCLYGTRDAALNWQQTLSDHLVDNGFVRGVGHPSVFHHATRDIWTLVHGDDYCSAGSGVDLDWLEGVLASKYEIKTQRIGRGKTKDGKLKSSEGQVLNRVVRRTDDGFELEADLRHAELIVEQLGLQDSKIVSTPGVDGPAIGGGAAEQEEVEEEALPPAEATLFRGIAARCNYLQPDRPDIQFAVKECCRLMSRPTARAWEMLKRVGRYLKGRPRVVWRFDWQAPVDVLDVHSDANWAGCRSTRKSSSGGTVAIGSHLIRAYSKTQAVVAKSSGESELYAVVRASSEALGILTLLSDFGLSTMRASVGMDASAAIGIVQRQGISKLRHVEVDVLWIQEQQARRLLPLRKVPGPRNPSDMGTKHIAVALLDQYLEQLSLQVVGGRAAIAQQLHRLGEGDRQPTCATNAYTVSPKQKRNAADRDVDSWASAGNQGCWIRSHRTSRRSLFTPYKVAGGPDRDVRLKRYRVTTGTYVKSGKSFKVTDDWLRASNAHRLLEESWTGTTVFNELPDYIEEAIIPDQVEDGSIRGGVYSLELLHPQEVARRAGHLPPPEHIRLHEDIQRAGYLHHSGHFLREEHWPIPEECQHDTTALRAEDIRHRGRLLHRAGCEPLKRRGVSRSGSFDMAYHPVHLPCTRSRRRADLECGGVVGSAGNISHNRPTGRATQAQWAQTQQAATIRTAAQVRTVKGEHAKLR